MNRHTTYQVVMATRQSTKGASNLILVEGNLLRNRRDIGLLSSPILFTKNIKMRMNTKAIHQAVNVS